MASDWNDDFLDLLTCLNSEAVEYVVIGAFALAQHGLPRATGDIDFFIRPTPENAERITRALRAFGAPLEAASVSANDFARAGMVYQIGVVPRRIDVLTEASGISFDEAWASRITRTIASQSAHFVGLDTLLKNKRATGRPKDLVDADALEALRRR